MTGRDIEHGPECPWGDQPEHLCLLHREGSLVSVAPDYGDDS